MGRIGAFTGHRPDKLPGRYNLLSEPNIQLFHSLVEAVKELYEMGVDEWWSGGALGSDQLFFLAVETVKAEGYNIKNMLAIPFSNMGQQWREPEDLARLNEMKETADQMVLVDTVESYQLEGEFEGAHCNEKYTQRNLYMIDRADICLAVFQDTPWNYGGGTSHAISRANMKGIPVIEIDPRWLDQDFSEKIKGLEFKTDYQEVVDIILYARKRDRDNPFSNIFI